jgi:hypothetical protein
VGLVSGGLDSLLALRIIRDLGVEVTAYRFVTPFFGWDLADGAPEMVRRYRQELGVALVVEPVWPEYLEVVRAPRYGYGKHLNPCLDCKLFMLRKAGEAMRRLGAAFVFTGEVLGQRPMSQRRDTMNLLERESGLRGRLVRPLSAQLFPPSLPEQEGILSREALHSFSGRSRTNQMELAARLGIRDYPTPAGGCRLTEEVYARRLGDLLRDGGAPRLGRVELLGTGRHLRLSPAATLVVGRNEAENLRIGERAGPADILLETPEVPGPTSLLCGDPSPEDIHLAARVTARYADAHGPVAVLVKGAGPGATRLLEGVIPLEGEACHGLLI